MFLGGDVGEGYGFGGWGWGEEEMLRLETNAYWLSCVQFVYSCVRMFLSQPDIGATM